MIRGAHIDLSILGAMEVDESGSIANWTIPGKMVKGMGARWNLVAGARSADCDDGAYHPNGRRTGAPKILKRCTLFLTGVHAVHTIITEMAVIDVKPRGLVLLEVAPGYTTLNARHN